MKIAMTAWMKMHDGSCGLEDVTVVENLEQVKRFKNETDDDTFDIVYSYHHLPNKLDYEDFFSYSYAEIVCNTDCELTEATALLILSTVEQD